MLRLLMRWLGWKADNRDFEARAERAKRGRPSSATAHLFSKDPARAARAVKGTSKARKPAKPSPGQKASGRKASGQKAPGGRPKPEFDPYNTGKFDRGASWERISKSQR